MYLVGSRGSRGRRANRAGIFGTDTVAIREEPREEDLIGGEKNEDLVDEGSSNEDLGRWRHVWPVSQSCPQ